MHFSGPPPLVATFHSVTYPRLGSKEGFIGVLRETLDNVFTEGDDIKQKMQAIISAAAQAPGDLDSITLMQKLHDLAVEALENNAFASQLQKSFCQMFAKNKPMTLQTLFATPAFIAELNDSIEAISGKKTKGEPMMGINIDNKLTRAFVDDFCKNAPDILSALSHYPSNSNATPGGSSELGLFY